MSWFDKFNEAKFIKISGESDDNSLAAAVRLFLPGNLSNKPFWLVVGKDCEEKENISNGHFDFEETSTCMQGQEQICSTPKVQSALSESVFGSPLKLQVIADLSADMNSNATSTPIAKKDFPSAVSYILGKQILNTFCKKNFVEDSYGTDLVIVLTYDIERSGQPIFHGVFKGMVDGKREILTFSVHKKVGKVKIDTEDLKINQKVDYECRMMASHHVLDQPDGMGVITLEAEWRDVEGKLNLSQLPNTDFFLKLSIQSGYEHSPLYGVHCDLQCVMALIMCLKNNTMPDRFPRRKAINENIEEFLQNLKDRVSPPITLQPYRCPSVSKILKLGDRASMDFTDCLWLVLSNSADKDSLTTELQTVFKKLKKGDIPAFVSKDNSTTISKLVRQSHTGTVVFPNLTDSLSVELLADIGVEKIYKDLMSLFIDNRLCTLDQWQSFFKSVDDSSTLFEKVSVLVELHYCLEIVSIVDCFTDGLNLREITRSLFKSCKSGALKEGQVFTYPITAAEALPEIKKGSAAMMSRESVINGKPAVDCFLSDLPSGLGFVQESSINTSDVSALLTEYFHFNTKVTRFVL